MAQKRVLEKENSRIARRLWRDHTTRETMRSLRRLTRMYQFSLAFGDLTLLNGGWYVTHTGLLGLARRNRCAGIATHPVTGLCDPQSRRWTFEATAYKTKACRGFVGYGDADPSNVSPVVHGAEMRVAETRAVNRALRKAYGIGICSVEEIRSFVSQLDSCPDSGKQPQPANGNGNYAGRTVRDHLCQLIRQHQLDPTLVKAYATDFCGTKTLREATREQVENFVNHLADWAVKDRNALLCQLNSYIRPKQEVVA
jgi:hypothetical protein